MTEFTRDDRSAVDGRAADELSNAGTDRLARSIDHQHIAARAYAIYESRRGAGGSADEDWRQAEAAYAIQRANEIRFG